MSRNSGFEPCPVGYRDGDTSMRIPHLRAAMWLNEISLGLFSFDQSTGIAALLLCDRAIRLAKLDAILQSSNTKALRSLNPEGIAYPTKAPNYRGSLPFDR